MAQLQAQQRPVAGTCPPGQQHAATAAATRWREGRRRQLAGACLQLPAHAQQQCSLAASLSWHELPQRTQYSSSASSSCGSHVRQRWRQRWRQRLQPCAALPRIASLETEPATKDRVPQYKMPKRVRSSWLHGCIMA